MNIQQFEYVLAVAETKHFEKAANRCCITQSTLSTMISKLEGEIGIRIFDRKKKPVSVTEEGVVLIEQLRIILREIGQLKEITSEIKGEVKGRLVMSVIPTIAPSLLPLFLQNFASKFPNLNIEVREQTTADVLRQIKSRELDVGIISIPVQDPDIMEVKLYDEPFLYYDAGDDCPKEAISDKLDMSSLCLLEEGHCMRTQVISLCDAHQVNLKRTLNFEYKAGSLDSLLRFVRANKASTLLPKLSTFDLPEGEKEKLCDFATPVPFRTVGLVVHRHFAKKKLLEALKNNIQEEVKKVLPELDLGGAALMPV